MIRYAWFSFINLPITLKYDDLTNLQQQLWIRCGRSYASDQLPINLALFRRCPITLHRQTPRTTSLSSARQSGRPGQSLITIRHKCWPAAPGDINQLCEIARRLKVLRCPPAICAFLIFTSWQKRGDNFDRRTACSGGVLAARWPTSQQQGDRQHYRRLTNA